MKTKNIYIFSLMASVIVTALVFGATAGIANAVTASSSSHSSSSSSNTGSCAICGCYTSTPALSISCSAIPGSIQTGQSTTFTPTVSGGTGSYTYSWTGECTGTSRNCSKSFSTPGTYTASLTVKSSCRTATTNCSVVVTQPAPTPDLAVTCSANPGSIQTGQSSTFTALATGGVGAYSYEWTGACTGTSQSCTNSFSNQGTQTATVRVTAGSQNANNTCSVGVSQTQTCTPNYQQRCVGNSMYWYDSCGAQGSYVGTCGNTCTPNYQQRCVGNSMYWYDSCGTQGSYVGTCGNTYSNPSLTVTKTVKNLTRNSVFSNSTYASPSDTVMFMITLQANGNQDVQNVIVKDTLPANLIYNNQMIVARSNNGYSNSSGDIMSGLNLNTISAGQTVTITYQTRVAPAQNFAFGMTTLTNSVSVSSYQLGYNPVSNASVIVTRSGVLGASTISTGLTNNFWVDSFFLPLLLALIGIWMWRAGMFFGIERWLDNKRKIRRGYKAQKELSARIAGLQKLGKV